MIIHFLRLLVTLFFFFQRKMYWMEAIIIANIMPWIFPYIAYTSGRYSKPIGLIEFIGILSFLIGSYLNSASEYLRYSWKKKDQNAGRVYTGGLFKYAVNIIHLKNVGKPSRIDELTGSFPSPSQKPCFHQFQA